MYIVARTDQNSLEKIFFPGSILDVKHGCHRQKMVREKNSSKSGKSQVREFKSLKEVKKKGNFKTL